MTSDSTEQSSVSTNSLDLSLVDPNVQVRLKSEDKQLQLILPKAEQLPSSGDWSEVWQEFKQRLKAEDRFWQGGTSVRVLARDRLLDSRQLQAIAETLAEVELKIEQVITSRRQTAVAAATAGYSVEQQSPDRALEPEPSDESREPPLYLKTTLRSGTEVRHPGTIVIFGDMNPGSSAIASGDILVLGRLRGIAHAGAQGNRTCQILALRMEATQLRIADTLARMPPSASPETYPEVAYIAPSGICLSKAIDFFRTHIFAEALGGWGEES